MKPSLQWKLRECIINQSCLNFADKFLQACQFNNLEAKILFKETFQEMQEILSRNYLEEMT
jgi:hypothetical protein